MKPHEIDQLAKALDDARKTSVPGGLKTATSLIEAAAIASEGVEFQMENLREGDTLYWEDEDGNPGEYLVVKRHRHLRPRTIRYKLAAFLKDYCRGTEMVVSFRERLMEIFRLTEEEGCGILNVTFPDGTKLSAEGVISGAYFGFTKLDTVMKGVPLSLYTGIGQQSSFRHFVTGPIKTFGVKKRIN